MNNSTSGNLAALTSPYRGKILISAYEDWIKKGDKVLDIGCGNGFISTIVKNQYSANITCCDIENYLFVDLPFKKIQIDRELPFANDSFDIALLNDVLHHIAFDRQNFLLTDALRVARKVLISEEKPTLAGKATDIVLNKLHYSSLKVPLTFRTTQDWENLFRHLGIKFITKELKRPLLYPFSHIIFCLYKD